ncbi:MULTISPECIES: OmpH family outer membrane protein [Brevundimonas]|uniref:OmpH family outer membrane protein n=1 Tax=Brevundimonas TaxID=41275 RepID=UPI001908A53B|nr:MULTISPECIES: OmpH family outer membrane protein [Brevundimonas]MDA0743019.1 OmpH family outer membrane protein [Pseudomonadota bacterium]MBK1968059.1 OmpH family outer membrane protein [Brevundimonas diminuta]MBK1974709.1 OmpH family outer membrane protein [Brevundimonas diminuta]MDA1322377.1 OmpH family outer membrane protein [Pseudomonadota bacterium]MDM8351334.1 OmpH family outer membrane protein [Brevundimonas diminuta]
MKLIALGAFALASLTASAALAQTQGPANPGPVIPGVCVYFNQRVLAQSTAGQAVQTRMEQLAQEVQGELQPYATAIQTEVQALQQGAATIPADQMNQRRQQLQQRVQEAQQLEGTRENELRYTLAEQRRKISEAVEPLLVAVYQEKGCGIMIDRESVFILNPSMDVTDTVIQRLNAQLPTLSFNRMPVPAQPQS